MSGNTDDPESTIPWPGFVDILSTVIIVFVFFMMMTSVIIFVLSEEVKKNAVEEARNEAKAEAMAQQAAGRNEEEAASAGLSAEEIGSLLKENKEMKEKIEQLLQAKAIISESDQQSVKQEGKDLQIVFGDFGATLKPETIEQIKGKLPFQGKITLLAEVPKASDFGTTRELALNRALNVRNVLIQNNVTPSQITLKIITKKEKSMERSYGAVTIEFGG